LFDKRQYKPPVKFEEIYHPINDEWRSSDSIQTSFEMSVQLNIINTDYNFYLCEDIDGYQYLFRNKKENNNNEEE
jgi:hypothetical protein